MSLRVGIRDLHFSVLYRSLVFIACLTRGFLVVYKWPPSITTEFIASRLLQSHEAVIQFEAALCNEVLQIKNMTETWEEMYDTMFLPQLCFLFKLMTHQEEVGHPQFACSLSENHPVQNLLNESSTCRNTE